MLNVLLFEGAKFEKIHSRLGSHFLLKLGKYCNLTVYGSNSQYVRQHIDEDLFETLHMVEHSNGLDITDVISRCGKPDVILTHQFVGSRALLPNNFDTCKIPKAILFYDTYVIDGHPGNDNKIPFIEKNNYNLVLRRGCASFYDKEIWRIPSVWLPFSVREETFYTDPESNYLDYRKDMITFVGSAYNSKNPLYGNLKENIDLLKDRGLLDLQGVVGLDQYPITIKEYILALAYALGPYRGHPAKVFELMGSGTGLITEPFSGRKRLFGSEDVCWFYKDQPQLVGLAKKLTNPHYKHEVYRVTRNALRAINERHLDKHRAVELVNILEALAGGSKIPSIWE